eukprot:CAMPEP_0171591942 /NCGR_PEP_ID=MMETSP0961-20121227/16531_1 /TAXON_ID=87120 /ORGANISM="Aurantiochytrium limacinum, Strain ATCCMYA-1381" /LENGTH=97 /DNA_ID=CAMNT_0012152101 /DNA_START=221 /DNA_END=515 /DNA_ORIENTATION=-
MIQTETGTCKIAVGVVGEFGGTGASDEFPWEDDESAATLVMPISALLARRRSERGDLPGAGGDAGGSISELILTAGCALPDFVRYPLEFCDILASSS